MRVVFTVNVNEVDDSANIMHTQADIYGVILRAFPGNHWTISISFIKEYDQLSLMEQVDLLFGVPTDINFSYYPNPKDATNA